MDPMISKNAITLTDNGPCYSVFMKNKKLSLNPEVWHKIMILNCSGINKDVLIKAVLDSVQPYDLIPVNYILQNSEASFLARNCQYAIEKLCQQNLRITNPINKNLTLKLKIILAYSTTKAIQVDVQDNIVNILNKRYNSNTKTLNLDSFHKDPDLKEYCVLSQPKLLYFVLHLTKTTTIHNLKLSNNEISDVSPMEILLGAKNLTSLDLRNNCIKSMTELTLLSSLPINNLWLDGNPLCDDYDDFTYFQAVKEVCPKIENLDGIKLRQNGFPALRRNYLCAPEAQELIDDFLEHYFTLYDTLSLRSLLKNIYNTKATFSLTSRYIQGQNSSATASLSAYKSISRNVLTMSDLARSEDNLFKGSENIAKALSSLPSTEHDPYTFTVDLVHFTAEMITLVVTGVFREPSERLSIPERNYGFIRTFVLSATENVDFFTIINEQLHVSNATNAQQQRAFKVVKVPRNIRTNTNFSNKNKEEMVSAVKALTTMNEEWSKKCLEECEYNISKALSWFVDMYKVDNIPEEAFASNCK